MKDNFCYKALMGMPLACAFLKTIPENNSLIDSEFIRVNPFFSRTTGLPEAQVLYKNLSDALSGLFRTGEIRQFARFIEANDEKAELIIFSAVQKKWFSIKGFIPEEGYFFCTITDITRQKNIETELTETEERYHELACHARSFSWESNHEGLITYISDSVFEVLGYRPEEIAGKMYFYDFQPSENREKLKNEVFNNFMHEHKPLQEFVHTVRHCNGQTIALSTYGFPFYRDGNFAGYRGANKDVTVAYEQQQALQQSEERLRQITENMSDVLWLRSPDNQKILYINRAYEKIWGQSRENLYNNPDSFISSIHPEDQKSVINAFQNYLDGCKFSTEYRIIRPDGQIRWIWARSFALYDSNGVIFGHSGLATDITNQKNIQETMHRQFVTQNIIADISAAFAKSPIESLEKAINYALKLTGKIFEADRSYVFLLSHDDKTMSNTHEWCEKNIMPFAGKLQNIPLSRYKWFLPKLLNDEIILTHIRDLPAEAATEKQEWKKQEIQSILMIPIYKHGKMSGFIGFDSVSKEKEWSSDAIGLLGLIADLIGNGLNHQSDFAGLKKARLDAEEAKKAAEEASKTKSRFLANMSHEIRTPLNGVIGFTELLMNSELDAESRQYAELSFNCANSLLDIINDILDFSKIEADKLELDFQKTDLIDLIEKSAGNFHLMNKKKQLQFLVNIQKNTPRFVNVDPIRLKQVLLNLLSNAIKFTHQGEVELSLSFEPLDNEKGLFHFTVRDTGIGISTEQQTKLFQAFSQVDASMTRKYGGTGLGLIISKSLLDKMGSNVKLESQPDEGTSFSFTLNLEYHHEETETINDLNDKIHSPDPEINPEQIRALIMIVDDVSTNLKLANTLIQKEYPNLRIISALNGMEAVQKFSLYKPGLILMDVHMPEMDGLEATAKIRQIEGESPEERTIIIAMTAAAFKEDRDKCFTAGMNDYVTKPIQAEKLSQALHKYLPAVKNNTNLLHFDQISMLEAFNGDRNFCREIITESLKNLTEHISIIESRPETEKIKLSAHSIKGLGLNIYCLELSEIAAKLQHEAETETEIKNLSNKIDLIKNEFAKIKPLLLEFISS